MTPDEELQDSLRRLGRAIPREPRAAVERELRIKFRARQKQRKQPWAYVAEAAAVLIALAGLYALLTHGRSTVSRASITGAAPARAVNQTAGFIALPYAQSAVPMEQPVIVRMKISLSELNSMGMAVTTAPRNEKVSADFLVGQDGVARAVRLVE